MAGFLEDLLELVEFLLERLELGKNSQGAAATSLTDTVATRPALCPLPWRVPALSVLLVVDVTERLLLEVLAIAHDELVILAKVRHPRPDGLRIDTRALPDGAAVLTLLHAVAYPVGVQSPKPKGK